MNLKIIFVTFLLFIIGCKNTEENPFINANDNIKESPCAKISMKIIYNSGIDSTPNLANIIDLSCKEKTNIEINASFNWSNFLCLQSGCNYRMVLKVCGKEENSWFIDSEKSIFTTTISTSSFNHLEFIEVGSYCDVELIFFRDCIYDLKERVALSLTKKIKLLDSNEDKFNEYTIDRKVAEAPPIIWEDRALSHCCCLRVDCDSLNAFYFDNILISQKYKNEISDTGIKHTIELAIKEIDVKYRPKMDYATDIFEYPEIFEYEWYSNDQLYLPLDNNYYIKDNSVFMGLKGECIHATFTLGMDYWLSERYKMNCNGKDELVHANNLRLNPTVENDQLIISFAGATPTLNEGCRQD